MAALLIEPSGDLVGGPADYMADPYSTFAPLLRDTDALGVDYAAPDHCGQFWYFSAAKMEPCLGLHFTEESGLLETPLDIARLAAAAYADLPARTEAVSAFLTRHPEHALMVERITLSARYLYAEVYDNLIAQSCLPLDMLRGKLGLLDADHPVSGRSDCTSCCGAQIDGFERGTWLTSARLYPDAAAGDCADR